MDTKELDNRFNYHAPTPEKQLKHEDIRVRVAEPGHAINNILPDGREKSLAITYLEIVMFFANAGIARNE